MMMVMTRAMMTGADEFDRSGMAILWKATQQERALRTFMILITITSVACAYDGDAVTFDRADLNQDGYLTSDEVTNELLRQNAGITPRSSSSLSHLATTLAANFGGVGACHAMASSVRQVLKKCDRAEFEINQLVSRFYEQWSKLPLVEIASELLFMYADRNGDGRISRREFTDWTQNKEQKQRYCASFKYMLDPYLIQVDELFLLLFKNLAHLLTEYTYW